MRPRSQPSAAASSRQARMTSIIMPAYGRAGWQDLTEIERNHYELRTRSAPRDDRPYGEWVRILVTGAAGFIGSHVVAALTDAGHDVVGLDNLHPAAHGAAPPAVSPFLTGDVRDRDAVTNALRGADAVVHQAAMVGMGVDLSDLPEYVSCNDLGSAVLLAAMAASGVRRLVLASSMVVYGEGAYACAQHGAVRPAPRRPSDLAAGRFEPECLDCAAPLTPVLIGEDAPGAPR